jgi:4-hydroxy-tetrahydrodipicolinate synthase
MSKEFQLRGVLPALVTPFTKEKEINEESFRLLIDHVFDHVDGFVFCGTTGEFDYMTLEERKKVFDICIDQVNGRKPVIAGTGAPGTRQTIELTKYAEDAGADACLAITPFFLHPSDKGIYEHYLELADSTDLPIVLYNIPQCVGDVLPRRVVEDLAEIDNIVGLKDSSGDLTYTMEIIEKVKGNINVVVGHDEVVLPALAGGCTGMILASAQIYPDIWQKVMKAVGKGDLETARKEQLQVQKLSRIFTRYGGTTPIKAALTNLGIKMGTPRKPLRIGGTILHEDRKKIRLELERIGKIPPSEVRIDRPDLPLERRFEDIGINADQINGSDAMVGEDVAGEGINRVSIDLVAGPKSGPVGDSFASQIVYLRHRFEALPSILEPNLSAKPSALIVPTVELKNLRQANIYYGPAQAGIARAISDKVEEGVIPLESTGTHVMLTKAFVHPNALERDILYSNFVAATSEAIDRAFTEVN